MRVRVFREGVPSAEAKPRTIMPRGVTWREPIPVLDSRENLVGMLTNIRREADGWVTAESSVTLGTGVGLMPMVVAHGRMTFDLDAIAGRLVSARVGTNPVWPGMKVGE